MLDLRECGKKNGINLNDIADSIQEAVIQAAEKIHPDLRTEPLQADPDGELSAHVEHEQTVDATDTGGEQRVSPHPVEAPAILKSVEPAETAKASNPSNVRRLMGNDDASATQHNPKVPKNKEYMNNRNPRRSTRKHKKWTKYMAYCARVFAKEGSRPLTSECPNLTQDGKPLTYKEAKAGPDVTHWERAEIEEFERLIESGAMRPIDDVEQPTERKRDTTYYNPQTKQKVAADGSVTYRIRGTAGGDKINYHGNVAARTAEMEVVKLLFQAAVSERKHGLGGKVMTADIKDFYLGADLERAEYMRIHLKYIPQAVIEKYKLTKYIRNNSVLFEINKCIYGLPQAGYLSQNRLIQCKE